MELIVRKNIEKQLEARKMPLAELSRLSGVPYPTLTDLMKNNTTPRVDTVGLIARGFGISPGKLLEEPDAVPEPKKTKEQLLVSIFKKSIDLDDDTLAAVLRFIDIEIENTKTDLSDGLKKTK